MNELMMKCKTCGADKVNDYLECHVVEADYPEVGEIENMDAKNTLVSAFQRTHHLRCRLMWTLIFSNVAVKVDEAGDYTYTLPKPITMRPLEMLKYEQQMIDAAKKGQITFLTALTNEYLTRSSKFFEKQYLLLTKMATKQQPA